MYRVLGNENPLAKVTIAAVVRLARPGVNDLVVARGNGNGSHKLGNRTTSGIQNIVGQWNPVVSAVGRFEDAAPGGGDVDGVGIRGIGGNACTRPLTAPLPGIWPLLMGAWTCPFVRVLDPGPISVQVAVLREGVTRYPAVQLRADTGAAGDGANHAGRAASAFPRTTFATSVSCAFSLLCVSCFCSQRNSSEPTEFRVPSWSMVSFGVVPANLADQKKIAMLGRKGGALPFKTTSPWPAKYQFRPPPPVSTSAVPSSNTVLLFSS